MARSDRRSRCSAKCQARTRDAPVHHWTGRPSRSKLPLAPERCLPSVWFSLPSLPPPPSQCLPHGGDTRRTAPPLFEAEEGGGGGGASTAPRPSQESQQGRRDAVISADCAPGALSGWVSRTRRKRHGHAKTPGGDRALRGRRSIRSAVPPCAPRGGPTSSATSRAGGRS